MVQAVDVTSLITASDAFHKAFTTATLLKTLNVNALIMGESGVGKKSLAKYILPDASLIDASDFEELLIALESSNKIIITNIDNSPNLKLLIQHINDNSVRVIATSKQTFTNTYTDEHFSVKFDILPLRERKEDVRLLIEKFSLEASSIFGGENKCDLEKIVPDLSENANSLRRQIMINYLLQDIHDNELMDIVQNYITPKLGSNNDYKELLYLYEVPLIRAGLQKFKSQLQLSDKLGLNRNTLRKKIADNKQYL